MFERGSDFQFLNGKGDAVMKRANGSVEMYEYEDGNYRMQAEMPMPENSLDMYVVVTGSEEFLRDNRTLYKLDEGQMVEYLDLNAGINDTYVIGNMKEGDLILNYYDESDGSYFMKAPFLNMSFRINPGLLDEGDVWYYGLGAAETDDESVITYGVDINYEKIHLDVFDVKGEYCFGDCLLTLTLTLHTFIFTTFFFCNLCVPLLVNSITPMRYVYSGEFIPFYLTRQIRFFGIKRSLQLRQKYVNLEQNWY